MDPALSRDLSGGDECHCFGFSDPSFGQKIAWFMSCHDVPRNHDKGSRTWFLTNIGSRPKNHVTLVTIG
jgi:hypothetical protein